MLVRAEREGNGNGVPQKGEVKRLLDLDHLTVTDDSGFLFVFVFTVGKREELMVSNFKSLPR